MAKASKKKTAKKTAAKATVKKSAKAHSKKASVKKSKSSESPSEIMGLIKQGVGFAAEKVEELFNGTPSDVVAAIKADHDGLRNYLDLLKDTSKDMTERRRAYEAFSALLKSHSAAEEKAVYVPTLELVGHDLHIRVAEGYVEHKLAEDLMKRLEAAKDPVTWSAHANVLAEIVEHHIKEEEREMLPMIRKQAKAQQNMEMLAEFISLRGKTQKRVSKKNAGVLDRAALA